MYTKPELLVEEFDLEDVITASTGSPVTGTDDGMGRDPADVSGPNMPGGSNEPFDDPEDPWDPFADLFPLG